MTSAILVASMAMDEQYNIGQVIEFVTILTLMSNDSNLKRAITITITSRSPELEVCFKLKKDAVINKEV